ncbi:MAG: tripartite tricarboxylate transporter substrate-binding protein [Pseudomonadota bacterium]
MECSRPSRRQVLMGSAAAIAASALAWPARGAEAFPTGNMRVVIPTAQGGGADRLARTFDEIWGKLLGVRFEYDFFPGGAGQVGYELYVGKRERDGYNLLFGNMGPEMIMYALQKPKYKFPDDFVYFCRLDVDDSSLFVRQQSPFRRIEDVVAEGKKRVVNVATSRIPHPASIGTLALGEATGAKFNLVPYAGGNPTSIAVLNGEADCGILPVSSPIALGDKVRVLAVFSQRNLLAARTGDAPPVNAVFGTNIPDLYSSRAWAIHTSVLDRHPDRFEKLNATARETFSFPAFKDRYEKTGAPWETIQYGDKEACTKYALAMVEMAERYRSFLTARN